MASLSLLRRLAHGVLPGAHAHIAASTACRSFLAPHALAAAGAACCGQRFMAGKPYTPLAESMEGVSRGSDRKFIESVDAAIRLNIDPRKADQALRGLAVLPHGTGKKMRIAVFATGPAAEAAKKAGACIVGTDDLVEKIKEGFLDFDRAVATPSCMSFASKVARVLGPRGLMPNPKLGTVTDDVEGIILRLNSGVPFKTDKEGNIHCAIGKTGFETAKIQDNLIALLRALNAVKPKSVGGQYILDVFVSSSMGASYRIGLPDINTMLGGAMAAAQVEATAHQAQPTRVKRGIDPKEWATVDIDTIASSKLKRYLVARRAAAAVAA